MSTQPEQDALNELLERMKELEAAVSTVRQQDEIAARKQAEREARKVYNKARTASNTLRREVHRVEDATQKSVYARQHGELDDRIRTYDRELRTLLRPPKKRVPGENPEDKQMEGILGGKDGTELDSGARVMHAAHRAQDDNLRILTSIEREANTVEATGEEIAAKLAQDTEKIRDIDKELNSLQANIDRAKGEVMWFARRMSTDKCFIVLLVLIVLGVCALIFWRLYNTRKDDSGDDAATDAPAEEAIAQPPLPSAAQLAQAAHTLHQSATRLLLAKR